MLASAPLGLRIGPQIAHAHGLALRAGHFARFLCRHAGAHADHRFDVMGDFALDAPGLVWREGAERLHLDRELVEAAASLDHELVMRGNALQPDQDRLDLRRINVDAADDEHVVVAPGDAADAHVAAAAAAAPVGKARDVARAIADHRQRLLGERRDDELSLGALGQDPAGLGIDDLEEKVVLPAVQAFLRLAFHRYARPHDLGQAVDVDGAYSEAVLQLLPHGLAPGLGAEHADLERAGAQIHPLALGDLGDVERVRGRRAEDARAEVLQQRHLAFRHPAGYGDHGGAEALAAVVRAQPAGKEAVAVGVMNDVAGTRAGACERARHER